MNPENVDLKVDAVNIVAVVDSCSAVAAAVTKKQIIGISKEIVEPSKFKMSFDSYEYIRDKTLISISAFS